MIIMIPIELTSQWIIFSQNVGKYGLEKHGIRTLHAVLSTDGTWDVIKYCNRYFKVI